MECCVHLWGSCSFHCTGKRLVKAGRDQREKKVAFKKQFCAYLCKGVGVTSNKALQIVTTCRAFAFLGLPLGALRCSRAWCQQLLKAVL